MFIDQPFRPRTQAPSAVVAVHHSDSQVVALRLQHAAVRSAFAGAVDLGSGAAPAWQDIPVGFLFLFLCFAVIVFFPILISF